MRSRSFVLSMVLLAGCGGGVPITVIIDDGVLNLSLESKIAEIEQEIHDSDFPGADTFQVGSTWPRELPSVCIELAFQSDPDRDGGRIDLSPDPKEHPERAKQLEKLSDGTVTRLDILDIILRVETNELGAPFPPLEIIAASSIKTKIEDREDWIRAAFIGGLEPAGCDAENPPPPILGIGETGDIPVQLGRGAATFLRNELMDPECQEKDPLECRELSLAVRSRFALHLEPGGPLPIGHVRLRPIIVATFFVDLF